MICPNLLAFFDVGEPYIMLVISLDNSFPLHIYIFNTWKYLG